MGILKFRQISSTQLNGLPRDRTVFFFPVGPLEDHGPHLPMGLDLDEAESLSKLCAERITAQLPSWEMVIMPPTPLGVDSNTSQIALRVRPHVLRDWLVDASWALCQKGFLHFVVFTGNLGPRQLTAIEDAGKVLRKRTYPFFLKRIFFSKNALYPTLVSASSVDISQPEFSRHPLWSDPPEHGGDRDTSVALAIEKVLVHPDYLSLPDKTDQNSWLIRWLQYHQKKTSGYWGRPRLASSDQGKKILDTKIDNIIPKLRAVWEGSNPQIVFKSWFSVFPPNKSFFKAWLLAAALAWLAIFWLHHSLQMMISNY